MTFITTCDGCGIRIGDGQDQRPPGMEGHTAGTYGLPEGTFHWCRGCAGIASKAVYAARPADVSAEETLIREAMTEARENPGKIITR